MALLIKTYNAVQYTCAHGKYELLCLLFNLNSTHITLHIYTSHLPFRPLPNFLLGFLGLPNASNSNLFRNKSSPLISSPAFSFLTPSLETGFHPLDTSGFLFLGFRVVSINMSSSNMKSQTGVQSAEQTLVNAKNMVGLEDESDFAYGTSVATCSASVRLGFIRKVYGILAAQLALTTVICAMFMFVPPLRHFAVTASGLLFIVSMVGTLGTLFALIAKKDSHPLNMQLLAGFTVFESLLVGSICAVYAASGLSYLVLEALVITLAIFGGITAYAFISKRDFSFLGGALYAGLLALIACSIINLLLGVTGNKSPALAFLISWGGSVLFSFYILYDSTLCVVVFHLLSFVFIN